MKNIYVVIASEHNVSSFQMCITEQPDLVLIIKTTEEKVTASAQRLSNLLNKNNIKTETLEGLSGNDVLETQNWAINTLIPKLRTYNNANVVLNMNGGTKIMILIFAIAYPWARLDYQALSTDQNPQPNVQEFSIVNNSCTNYRLKEMPLHILSPQEHAELYFDDVSIKTSKVKTLTNINNPQLFDEEIFQIYQTKHHAWWSIAKKCGEHLFGDKNKEPCEVKWAELSQEYEKSNATPASLKEWLQHSNQYLGHNKPFWTFTETGFTMPQGKHESWPWLVGGWFERWVALQLKNLQEKYPSLIFIDSVDLVLKPVEKNAQANKRDADIILQFDRKKLTLVEIKTDLPENKDYNTTIRQIGSLAKDLGKVRQVLIITPVLLENLENKQDSFKNSCKNNNIDLWLIQSKADLEKFLLQI